MTSQNRPSTLIEIRNLTTIRGNVEILRDITLKIPPGQRVAIMGANGSGKSTLIRHMNAILLPSSGSVKIGSLTTAEPLHFEEIRRLVGMVFQEPHDQMVAVTVERELAFGLENLAWERDAMLSRIDLALGSFRLEHLRQRATSALSGGEQQRVAIAAIWVSSPDVLILDEPTSMLDSEGAQDVMGSLEDICGQQTTIHVTQSIEEARKADRVILISHGEIVADDIPEKTLFDESELARLGIGRRRRETSPRQEKVTEGKNSPPYIEVTGLHHTLRDGPSETKVLKGVDLSIERGCVTVLTGPSGSGKTTLAHHLNALLKPSDGHLVLDGEEYADLPVHTIRQRVGMAFQWVDLQLFGETVEEDILFGPEQLGMSRHDGLKLAEEWMDRFGLSLKEFADRSPSTLSMGEKRRVALVGALVLSPETMVLDEPTAGLDGRGIDTLIEIIEDMKGQNLAVVVVTHDMEFARAVGDQIVRVEDGKIIA